MGHLESALEWLRPFILGSNSWDYCVVWKICDDPSRFIEYVGCCCNGVKNQKSGKKRKSVSISACKDASSVHPAITKSCEALAQLPPYMSLDTSVHGEVVVLSQPRWIHISRTADDSKLSNEEFKGTRVLIPVLGGLVELFSTEHVSEDESIIQYVQCQCNGSETETLSNSTITSDGPFYPLLEKTLDTLLSSITQFNISPDSTPGSVSQATPFMVKEESEGSQKVTKKHCKSKNLLTERNRRKRISDGMLTLRSIVPKITKLQNAATLSDAVDYIVELQNEQRKLLDELENSDEYSSDFEPTSFKTSNQEHSTFSPTKSSLSQAQVEVNQIGAGNYLLRVESQQSRGVITRLLEAVGSLDVAVVDFNATVCNGRMSSNIIVQTKNEEVQEKDLREHLMVLLTV